MGSAKFTMFKLSASNQLWEDAEQNKKMEIKNEQGLSMDIKLCFAENRNKFRDNMYADRLFGLPSGGSYVKVFYECLCNALKDFSEGLTKDLDRDEYEKPFIEQEKTQDGLPVELRNQVAEIGQLLQWIVNSTSWTKGVFEPFDAFEIREKLKCIILYSDITIDKDKCKENNNHTIYPSFDFINADKINPNESCVNVGQSIGDLIDKTMKLIASGELEYEERFYYTAVNNHFNLYRKNQLV